MTILDFTKCTSLKNVCKFVVHLGSTVCLEYTVEKNERCHWVRTTNVNTTNKQTNYLTSCMEPSPSWKANRFSSTEIPRISWNPEVHYRIHKRLSPVPILNQINPIHVLSSHFLKIRLNIIVQSTSGSSKWSPTLRYSHQNSVYASLIVHPCYIPRPSHSSRFDHPSNIWWAVQMIKLLIM